jgi:small conductance mechanosensitive channel
VVDIGTIIFIAQVASVIAGSWLVAELLIRLITRGAKRAGASADLIRSVREALSILWVIFVAVGLVSVTGIGSIFSFLTLSGIAGLAISLALQNTLTNIISGILILSDGVLRLHDSIEYSGVKGRVVKIGLRATWVKTDSGDIAIISNNYLANGPLVNFTASERLERKLRL